MDVLQRHQRKTAPTGRLHPQSHGQKKRHYQPTADDVEELSMSERLTNKQNGFCGLPLAAPEALADDENEASEDEEDNEEGTRESKTESREKSSTKRLNKNCPRETTSKRPVGRFREVITVAKTKARDPRFDALCGKFNADLFSKAYSFLEQYKDSEIDELKIQVKKMKNRTKAVELKTVLTKLQQERAMEKRQARVTALHQRHKQEERKAVANGKSPFYLKRSDKKKLEYEARFNELNESGQLNKFLAKKRKKNANKDHRWLPTSSKE